MPLCCSQCKARGDLGPRRATVGVPCQSQLPVVPVKSWVALGLWTQLRCAEYWPVPDLPVGQLGLGTRKAASRCPLPVSPRSLTPPLVRTWVCGEGVTHPGGAALGPPRSAVGLPSTSPQEVSAEDLSCWHEGSACQPNNHAMKHLHGAWSSTENKALKGSSRR